MSRIVRFAVLSVALGVAVAPLRTVAAQDTTPVVAVVPFTLHAAPRDTRDFAGIGTAVADLLAADLAAGASVRLTERAPLRRAVDLQPPSRRGGVDRSAAVAAAKLLGAQHVVYGGFTADATGNVRLDSRAVNVSTGAVEFTERIQGRGDDVVSLVRQLAARLIAGMPLPASTAAATGASAPVSLRSLVAYGKALDFADHGDRAQAEALLSSVIADNPGFAPAKSALAGLQRR